MCFVLVGGSTSWVRGVSWMHVVDTACRGITGREVLYTNGIDLLLSICFTDLIFIKYEFNLTSNKKSSYMYMIIEKVG